MITMLLKVVTLIGRWFRLKKLTFMLYEGEVAGLE